MAHTSKQKQYYFSCYFFFATVTWQAGLSLGTACFPKPWHNLAPATLVSRSTWILCNLCMLSQQQPKAKFPKVWCHWKECRWSNVEAALSLQLVVCSGSRGCWGSLCFPQKGKILRCPLALWQLLGQGASAHSLGTTSWIARRLSAKKSAHPRIRCMNQMDTACAPWFLEVSGWDQH